MSIIHDNSAIGPGHLYTEQIAHAEGLKDRINALETQKTTFQEHIGNAERKISELHNDITRLEAENASLQQRLDGAMALASTAASDHATIQDLRKRLAELEQLTTGKGGRTIEQLLLDLEEALDARANAEEFVTGAHASVEALGREHITLKAQLEEYRLAYHALTPVIATPWRWLWFVLRKRSIRCERIGEKHLRKVRKTSAAEASTADAMFYNPQSA